MGVVAREVGLHEGLGEELRLLLGEALGREDLGSQLLQFLSCLDDHGHPKRDSCIKMWRWLGAYLFGTSLARPSRKDSMSSLSIP